jgi:rubredoxin
MIYKVPLKLPTGEIWHLNRDEAGYYCPVCGKGPSSEAPFEDFGEGPCASHGICSVCRTEYGLDLSFTPGDGLSQVEWQLLVIRVTWLCRTNWQEISLEKLQSVLGISRKTIAEYEFLAGREQKLDERFRRKHKKRSKRQPEPTYSASCPTCPCCGHLGAICVIFGRCSYCGWVYVPQQEIHPTQLSEHNPVSLLEAQRNYVKFGAATEEIARIIRKPEHDHGIDPEWRPLETGTQS